AAPRAGQAECLALGDMEGDAADRGDLSDGVLKEALFPREVLDQPPDRQQWCGGSHATASRSEWKQAAKCPGSFSSKTGISRSQTAVANVQRVANGQPGIGSLSDGTVPEISASRGACSVGRGAPSRGTDARSPFV